MCSGRTELLNRDLPKRFSSGTTESLAQTLSTGQGDGLSHSASAGPRWKLGMFIHTLPSDVPGSQVLDPCYSQLIFDSGQTCSAEEHGQRAVASVEQDPQRWEAWRRNIIFMSLGYYCFIGGSMTSILGNSRGYLAGLRIPMPQPELVVGLYLIGMALGSAVLGPTAVLYGKRLVYNCTALVLVATVIWCAQATTLASLLVARLAMGLVVSPIECLLPITVGELFYLREKTYRLGVYALCLLCGQFLMPLISVAIEQQLQWRWTFRIVATAAAISCGLLYFCVPETSQRQALDASDTRIEAQWRGEDNGAAGRNAPAAPPQHELQRRDVTALSVDASIDPQAGRHDRRGWWRVALRPLRLIFRPHVLWSATIYSLSAGWTIVLCYSIPLVYSSPDAYSFTAIQVGVVFLSPLIGCVLGTVVAGRLSDAIAGALARHNDGKYEPEYRLIVMLPVAFSTCAGLIGYGLSVDVLDHWWVPTVFLGIASFGCSAGIITAITITLDSSATSEGEALISLCLSKNIVYGLIFSLAPQQWLGIGSIKVTSLMMACIHLTCILTTIPLYVFGKQARFRMS